MSISRCEVPCLTFTVPNSSGIDSPHAPLLQKSGRAAEEGSVHMGSQYDNFTRKTSLEGALRSAEKSRPRRKLPSARVSDRFSFQTTKSAEPGRNSHRTTALPRRLRKPKSGLLSYAN